MVNRGRSKGCANCRARHVKCDEKRPVCRNCVKLKQECPGYDDVFDRMHKSENKSVERRVTQRQEALAGRSTRGSTKRSSTRVLVSIHARQSSCASTSPSLTSNLYNSPSPVPETWAIDIWFNLYQRDCTDDFGVHLQRLYGYSSLDSPLRPAVTALALGTSLYWMTRNFNVPLVWKYYAEAMRSLREAVKDSERSMQDDVLMAALVLDLAEGLRHQFLPEGSSAGSHRPGAVALLKQRGPLNQRDEGSKSMASTLRAWVANDAIARGVSTDQPPALQDQEEELNMPADQLTRLCYRVLDIQTRYEQVMDTTTTDDLPKTRQLLQDALNIDTDLVAWQESLTALDRPVYTPTADVEQSIQGQGVYGTFLAVFSNMTIADMYCKYNLLQLRLLDIIMRLGASRATLGIEGDASEVVFDATSEFGPSLDVSLPSRMLLCIDEIMSSVPFYLGDISWPITPLLSHQVSFPRALTEFGTYPLDYEKHQMRAVAAAGVYILYTLATLLRFMETDEGLGMRPYDLGVEEKQVQWVKGQMERINRIFRIRAPSREVLEQWCHE
ncbi:hypothetical protein K491DRAFT_781259 [Lophiostoma macrostomum CBS 122681]|uniref:Zn(2)-C6 fungal-type domain-containing protein n=1 Tax=Lophiostoma macrostomum CBS 122681 TaxID=1314788 RepID=A0A6A6SYV1_9PLEO|nr:hypothetical protein K491DRAFT_781259 [Lophiostoma macrostomum CBS 122681]